MKIQKIIFITFFFIGLTSPITANTLPSWFVKNNTNINNIIKKSKKLHKRVILFFDLKGCPYCVKMIKANLSGGRLTKETRKYFIVVHIDSEGKRIVKYKNFKGTEKDFKKKMKAIFSPTMIFLDKSGNVIAKFEGYRNPKKYKNILGYIVSGSYKKYSFYDYLNEVDFERK